MVWEASGITGLDPHPLTLRQLSIAADARIEAAWDQTSVLWALHAEMNRDDKQRRKPFTPYDIHPFYKSAENVGPRPISELGAMFNGRKID